MRRGITFFNRHVGNKTCWRLVNSLGSKTSAVQIHLGAKETIENRLPFHHQTVMRFLNTEIAKKTKVVVPFNLSDIGEGIGEVVIKEWFVSPGQKVAQFDSICEVQSDKASVTITSKFDGIIKRLYYEVDGTARVGLPLVDIELDESSEGEREQQLVDEIIDQDASTTTPLLNNQEHHRSKDNVNSYKKTLTTPAVRRLAMENNLDLKLVTGTGKEGRIMKEDVLEFLNRQVIKKDAPIVSKIQEKQQKERQTQEIKVPEPRLTQDKKVPLTAVQKSMVRTMTESLKIPHLGLSDNIDMDRLVNLKKTLFPRILKETGLSLTFLPLFMKAASIALSEFPMLNAVFDEGSLSMVYKSSHNICIAMDTPGGLLVPSVKDVQSKNILEIALEVKRMQEDIKKKGSLELKDLSGGSFTLSNIGSIGGSFGIPVILPPQVIIGALGRINTVPTFDAQDNVVKGHVMKVLWSADHRVIDGATVTRFNQRFKGLLQDPVNMTIYLK